MSENLTKINLTSLAEIGQNLADSAGLRDGLSKALAIIHKSDLFVRSFAALYEPRAEKLSLYASEGFGVNEYRRLENRLNRSFPGIETGDAKPVFIEKTSLESSFDFVAPRHEETSFLGVPIVLGKRKAGFLGVEAIYDDKNDFDSLFDFLAAIAAMISQALKSQTEIATEKEKLIEETSHLQHELREKYDFNNLIGNSGPMRQIYDSGFAGRAVKRDGSAARRIGNGQGNDCERDSLSTACARKNRLSKSTARRCPKP